MKNDLDIIIPILTIAAMFGGLIWRLAAMKSALEFSIDSATDLLLARINALELEIRIAQSESLARKDFLDYRLHGHDEQITHKFDRCWAEIKQIQNFLTKDGFIPRDTNKSKT
ncbi:hypothetical protein [Nostoc sp.]|uniref:hypothetical protein n=1 Tax=Nostoc sp. TaxID=1180 RepID=UPI002FFC72AF